MLASLFALTAGYTGQHDTVIGTSVNNRTAAYVLAIQRVVDAIKIRGISP